MTRLSQRRGSSTDYVVKEIGEHETVTLEFHGMKIVVDQVDRLPVLTIKNVPSIYHQMPCIEVYDKDGEFLTTIKPRTSFGDMAERYGEDEG